MHDVWYGSGRFGWLLIPLSGLYRVVTTCRKALYRWGVFGSTRVRVPVVIVGNLTAGGTGKTPTVIWLAKELAARGYQPGIVSRGYGGSHNHAAMRVDEASEASVVGDEPLLLARRTGCPVVVDRDRVRGAEMLVDIGATVVLADDGLQHLRLSRDFEVCVIDGQRGLGNGRLMPAGPLREAQHRLQTVDQVLVNGEWGCPDVSRPTDVPNMATFRLQASTATSLDGRTTRPLASFQGEKVHAVAGIGHPDRFFDLLRQHGIEVIEHAFADHAPLSRRDLRFADECNVLMTEKDAVKMTTPMADRYWFVPVDLSLDENMADTFLERLVTRLAAGEGKDD